MLDNSKSTQRSTLKIRSVKRLYHGSDQKFDSFDDIIYDRMADNNFIGISDILQKYIEKEIPADKAIEQLRWNNETADQYCFKTERALSLLTDQKIYIQYKNKKGLWQHGQPLLENTERQVN